MIVTKRGNNQSPFHDRYLISEDCGLRFGTSIKDMGHSKLAEISRMDSDEAFNAQRNAIEVFLNQEIYEIDGERLRYKTFEL